MNDFRSQDENYKKGKVRLITKAVQVPRSLIGNGGLVKPFGCYAARFSYSDGSFAVASKDFDEIHHFQFHPILELYVRVPV
jgi:hypothetical protein